MAAQGLIWGIMAIGVYITFRILDVADLTVDGTMATGGAAFIMLTMAGAVCRWPCWGHSWRGAGGTGHRPVPHRLRHSAILAGILTQLALYSVNLRIMGQANRPVSSRQYDLLVDQQSVRSLSLDNPILVVAILWRRSFALLYWFFGTELGASLRATGSNPNMSRAQGINTNFTKVLGLMLSNGLVALSSALLAQYQGLRGREHGPGRHRHRPGRRHHRRGDLRQGVPQLCPEAAGCGHRRHHLLPGVPGGHLAGPEHRRHEAHHRPDRGGLPGHPLLEGEKPTSRFRQAAMPEQKQEGIRMLEIKEIWKTFNAGTVNEKQALRGVSLTLKDGDFCTVIGGNGAGKSTMLNAVAGTWPVDSGAIVIDGWT